MKAIRLTEYGRLEVQDIPTPSLNDHQVLVKVNYASICGSDQHIIKGDFHPRTKLPMTPGHEFSGRIIGMGSRVKDYKQGELVAIDPIIWCGECPACKRNHYPACTNLKLLGVDMDGGFAENVAVDADKVYHLPPDISVQSAALIELYSIGFHACRRAGMKEGDNVVIWGAGKVGQVILQAARTITDSPVYMVDILENRLNVARQNYQDVITINAKNENPVEIIQTLTNGNGVDVAFEAVGHAKSIKSQANPVQNCILSIRGAGTVCVLGLSGEASRILTRDLIWREAKIVASRVNQGEFQEVIDNLSAGHLKPDILISKEVEPSQAMEAFQLLEDEPENYLKILIRLSDKV